MNNSNLFCVKYVLNVWQGFIFSTFSISYCEIRPNCNLRVTLYSNIRTFVAYGFYGAIRIHVYICSVTTCKITALNVELSISRPMPCTEVD